MKQKNFPRIIENDLKHARTVMEKAIRKNYKSPQEWEDKHPILATLIIISAFLFRPLNLIIGGIIAIIIFLLIK